MESHIALLDAVKRGAKVTEDRKMVIMPMDQMVLLDSLEIVRNTAGMTYVLKA
jgi:hypothetical protein